MAVSMRDLDPAFQGAGQKAGLEIWRIEKFRPVSVPQSSHGKFYMGDSYVVLKVSFARSTLNHDDIFILDTKYKVFQFSGSNSSIQERGKALEVVQYIKDTYHEGKCDTASLEDENLMADADTGEFWALFGGFAPLPRKTANDEDNNFGSHTTTLLRVDKGKAEPVEADSLGRELLETNKCYLLDCGLEVFVWMGRSTSLDERRSASEAAEELLRGPDRSKTHMIRVIEGFETVMFKSKFNTWPEAVDTAVSEDGRGKVAALLKRQEVNVKGLLKSDPVKEEPQPYIDCTGNLQVWRVNGHEKILLPASDQSKIYRGDCYIFQYSYLGEDKEEHLIGTWFGKQSVEEERTSAISLASSMVASMKFLPTQARIHEGKEPIQFYLIFQSLIVFKGGLSDGYKKYVAENEVPDDTYQEDGVALFRVQGSGPDNMQAIQVEAVASSLDSTYCYILHSGTTVFTWSGSLATTDDQELVERLLDLIKPNLQTKPQKENSESEQFWELLGGKAEHSSQKIVRDAESDPHLFSCVFSNENMKVAEIYNFTQDDLMTEDIFILDCLSDIFVWIGQEVNSKDKVRALTIGEKFLELDFLMEKLSREAPIYIVMEGSEPPFFTRFFTWDSAKSNMHGNSFQRKLTIVKHGRTPVIDKPKRRTAVSYGGRFGAPEKSQRSRSMSFSPDQVRVRGRSPAFNALDATFESSNTRNLSTPPPMVRKSQLYPKSGTSDTSKSSAIAALTAGFERKEYTSNIPRSPKGPFKSKSETNNKDTSTGSKTESPTIEEDVKEGEPEDEGVPVYPYEQVKTSSTDPVADIDVTRREIYLSAEEFREHLGMEKGAFYKLPSGNRTSLKRTFNCFDTSRGLHSLELTAADVAHNPPIRNCTALARMSI